MVQKTFTIIGRFDFIHEVIELQTLIETDKQYLKITKKPKNRPMKENKPDKPPSHTHKMI